MLEIGDDGVGAEMGEVVAGSLWVLKTRHGGGVDWGASAGAALIWQDDAMGLERFAQPRRSAAGGARRLAARAALKEDDKRQVRVLLGRVDHFAGEQLDCRPIAIAEPIEWNVDEVVADMPAGNGVFGDDHDEVPIAREDRGARKRCRRRYWI
jgi:hypothetical protein